MSQNRLKRSKRQKDINKANLKIDVFLDSDKKDILTKLENNLSKYSHKKRELEKSL